MGTQGGGLGLFHEKTGSFTQFSQDSSHGNLIFQQLHIRYHSRFEGFFVACYQRGDHQFQYQYVQMGYSTQHTGVKTMHNKILVKCFKSSNGHIWILDLTRPL
jgi:hypothetical protein